MPGRMDEEPMTGLVIASAVGAMIGIILIFLGNILLIYGNSSDATKAALTLNDTGVFLTGFTLISGGILSKNTDKYIRLALIVAGALVIGLLWGASLGYYRLATF